VTTEVYLVSAGTFSAGSHRSRDAGSRSSTVSGRAASDTRTVTAIGGLNLAGERYELALSSAAAGPLRVLGSMDDLGPLPVGRTAGGGDGFSRHRIDMMHRRADEHGS
jgi:hypothetical protein